MTSDHSSNGNGHFEPTTVSSGTDTTLIRSLVSRTRRLLRSTWVVTGLLASFGLGLLLVVTTAMTDFVVSSAVPSEWTALRAIALVLLVVPTTWAVIAGVLRPLFRRLSNVLVARRIETQLPKIHNRLVTCIDLDDEERAVPVSEAFHRKLVFEALERIRDFNPRRVLDIQNLRRAGVVATVGVLALAVVFIPGVRTAMARVFNPFSDIPPAGHVAYTVKVGNTEQQEQGDGYVVRGDDVEFLVEFTDNRRLYEDELLQLVIETVNDENEAVVIRHSSPGSGKLEMNNGLSFWQFGLKGLEHDFHYRVSGGGTYTRRYFVEMLERPEIVGVSTRLNYPEYMEKPERFSPVADIEGPIGSNVSVDVVAEGDVHDAKIEFLELKRVRQDVADRSPRNWFGSTRPKGSAPSGTWQVNSLAGQPAHTDPPNTAIHSHGFTKAAEPFQVGTDDVLFATVYLPPDQSPRQIMLKWHDGQGWEHRAFWGEDLIGEGKPGTASRFHVGDLPEVGRLVTLEVPATAVGLAGRVVSGMMFSLHGGQAVWGTSGAMPPAQETVVKLVPTGQTYDLKSSVPAKELKEGQSHFTGVFPLLESGLYRVQLKNRADRYNLTMAEAKIVAIPDNPPQVIIERPRQTLILTQPQPVPVFITSFDDFGVKDIVLSVKTGDQDSFVGEPVVTLSPPLQNDHRDITIDLSDRGLKTGDTLTYRVEVRDGNGQSGQTIDYVIQIKDDAAAADKQFEQLEKQTDTFRDKLVELISQQKKIQNKSNELEENYKDLTEKIEKAKADAEEQKKKDEEKDAKKDADDKKKADKPEAEKPVELDPEEQKKLAELKKELAKLAADENKNAALSEQVKNDLGALAKQAEENPLVPPQVAEQIKQLEGAFEKAAVDPLKQLAKDLQEATKPKEQDTKLPEINKKAERVQKDLESIQKRMDALARAQRDSRDDLKQAMKDLKKDLLEQNAELTRDALQDLKEYLKAMQKDLEALKGKEENLLKDSLQDLTSKDLLEALREQQKDVAKKSEKKLDDTADLLGAERKQQQRDFPDRPYKPEDENYKIPPKEQDTDEGEPTNEDQGEKKKGEKQKGEKKKGDDKEAEEEFFLPKLEGLRAELDPRFEKMIRDLKEKLKKQQENGKKSSDPEQQERNRDQLQRLEELESARRALKGNEKSLDNLQDQLKKAQQKSEQSDQQQQGKEEAQQNLEQLLQDALTRKAQKMMQRMQQQQQQAKAQPGEDPQKNQQKNQPMPPQQTLANQLIGNQDPDGQGTDQVLVDLSKLDVATRRVILKMQPKEREELLQGLREDGPKAYRGFIRDYFKKLSRVRAKGSKK